MMLCLLPVTLTLAALAADVGDAAVVDKRFRLRPVDPLTRRSTMDKNFMRLGRAFDCWTSPEDVAAAATAKRVDPAVAIGRRDSNFMRFGRGEVYTPGDNKIPRRHYDVDVDGLEVRFGRSAAAGPAADRGAPSAYDRRRRRRR